MAFYINMKKYKSPILILAVLLGSYACKKHTEKPNDISLATPSIELEETCPFTNCLWLGVVENSVMGRVRVVMKFSPELDYFELVYWDPKMEYPSEDNTTFRKVECSITIQGESIFINGDLRHILKDENRLASFSGSAFNGNLYRLNARSLKDWMNNKTN